MRDLLLIALLLACPLMMMFMMRSSHGHSRGGSGASQNGERPPDPASIDELRRQRAELDRQIAARETGERASTELAGGPVTPLEGPK